MYIRTKDGVYELVDNLYQYYNGVEKFWYAKEENGKTLAIEITANEILNQSENLYELCDEFMVMLNDRCEDMYSSYENLKNSAWYRDDIEIKGAIYTDKGLIYVAKLNDEGELELL